MPRLEIIQSAQMITMKINDPTNIADGCNGFGEFTFYWNLNKFWYLRST
jgi:hypothetical protein